LQICGWSNSASVLEGVLQTMEAKGEWDKAAGWAIFHGRLQRAIEALTNSKDEKLTLVSVALAASNPQDTSPQSGVWRHLCRNLSADLHGPYLRAIFAYIGSGDWSAVLKLDDLSLRDRLGIALRFLGDDELFRYIHDLADHAVRQGQIEGILLTGLTPRGIDLLGAYVDRTGDIQTACLVVSQTETRRFRDHRVDEWIDSYRRLLDRWRMYQHRALLDIARGK
ncbi:hypothetical protein BJ684DRAFT_1125, partial [Piptocephalis cylindrospora]